MIFGQLDRSVSEFISRCGSETELKISGTYHELVGRKHGLTYDKQGNRLTHSRNSHTTNYSFNNLNQYTARTNYGFLFARKSPKSSTALQMSAQDRASLDARLCRVPTQLHPRLRSKPVPALDLRMLATNFVRFPGVWRAPRPTPR